MFMMNQWPADYILIYLNQLNSFSWWNNVIDLWENSNIDTFIPLIDVRSRIDW